MGKTLYVCRPLENADEFIAWAKTQGFPKTVPAEELHCTIIYSKQEMPAWPDPDTDRVTIRNASGREVMPLGDMGAVVLKFNAPMFKERWQELHDLGAKSDYPDYTAHVTITYDGADVDLENVEPFTGALQFGPEKLKEIDPDWSDKIMEKGYNPNQPREPKGSPNGGQWTDGGAPGSNADTPKGQFKDAQRVLSQAGYRWIGSGTNDSGPWREYATSRHPKGRDADENVNAKGATITVARSADGKIDFKVDYTPGRHWDESPTGTKRFTDVREALEYADSFHKGETALTTYNVMKVDEELGIVFGWALVSEIDGAPYFDVQGDHVPEDAMLKATSEFMEHVRVGKDMHQGDQCGVMVHSMPLTKDIARSFGITCDRTGWMVGYKPYDKALLAKFRNGDYTGFSIGGSRIKDEHVV